MTKSPKNPSQSARSDVSAAPVLEDRRFLFVCGKGGVGKTTVSGALALAFASRGKRVLVAMCNTKERLSAILGSPPIGDEIMQVSERVWAVNISPDKALREYGEMVLKVKAVAHAVFDNKYTKTFFRAVPGLSEWAMLGKAWFHTTETLPDGSFRYDVVILDAPATGHGMEMLRVPRIILDVAPAGALRRDAEAAWEMFRDPARAGVVVVTLPEELPATESVELTTAIRSDLGLPVHRLVINAAMAPLFSAAERERLLGDARLLDIEAPLLNTGTPRLALVAGARRAMREAVQHETLERLRHAIDLPMVTLPFLLDEASTPAGTRRLAKRL
ncbi:ArsA family ATPase [Chondromyces apiculatus]|uniref:arsenite-transporting ATPase n=1 Tax=Chondromyces apiculatus DSM 436 TaxID=1192034 RepID=A0A017T4Z4_9BACT|nr:ArsA family ATPase [Chondromyces apiculatus]EYF03621.1 Arsenical pump-driving ATPase [Chondromyces apiculatus DSM 436]